MLNGAINSRLYLIRLGDIGHIAHGLATGLLNFLDHGLHGISLYVGHHDRQTIGRQHAGRGGTNAGGCTRYQNRVAGK